jgi:hypothetical protein
MPPLISGSVQSRICERSQKAKQIWSDIVDEVFKCVFKGVIGVET